MSFTFSSLLDVALLISFENWLPSKLSSVFKYDKLGWTRSEMRKVNKIFALVPTPMRFETDYREGGGKYYLHIRSS